MRKKNLIQLNQSYETQIDKANEKISELNAEIETLNEEISDLKNKLANNEEIIKNYQNEISAKSNNDMYVESEISETETPKVNQGFVTVDDFDESIYKNGFHIATSGFDFSFNDITDLGAAAIGRIIIKSSDAAASIDTRKLPDAQNLLKIISEKEKEFKIEVFKILSDLDLDNPKEELNRIISEIDAFFATYII